MPKDTLDPNRKLVHDFQSGRISRRQFLAAVTAMMGATAVAAVPAFAAPKPTTFSRARRQGEPTLMIYAASQDIATIDPFDRTDYSIGAVMRQMYDRLFRFEGGWPQPVDPGLAQSWSASEDASEWTVVITDQAVFHDGTPVTSADVVFSYQATLRAQKPRSSLLSVSSTWTASLLPTPPPSSLSSRRPMARSTASSPSSKRLSPIWRCAKPTKPMATTARHG